MPDRTSSFLSTVEYRPSGQSLSLIRACIREANRINSKVLAFTFSISADIERQLISQRTKKALARKKSEGIILGCPKGSLSKETKFSGKEQQIIKLLDKKVSYSAIGRIMGVNRLTVS